jgi:NADH-quinone oxidoreductase subunit B
MRMPGTGRGVAVMTPVRVDLPFPSPGGSAESEPEVVSATLALGSRRFDLSVFNEGLACCALECVATTLDRQDLSRFGALPFVREARRANVLVVSGTVTDKLAPAILRLHGLLPKPSYVISFGACSNSGGPYWDSYCVTKGVDQLIPVDVYVPGCPPRPEALLAALLQLHESISSADVPG